MHGRTGTETLGSAAEFKGQETFKVSVVFLASNKVIAKTVVSSDYALQCEKYGRWEKSIHFRASKWRKFKKVLTTGYWPGLCFTTVCEA